MKTIPYIIPAIVIEVRTIDAFPPRRSYFENEHDFLEATRYFHSGGNKLACYSASLMNTEDRTRLEIRSPSFDRFGDTPEHPTSETAFRIMMEKVAECIWELKRQSVEVLP